MWCSIITILVYSFLGQRFPILCNIVRVETLDHGCALGDRPVLELRGLGDALDLEVWVPAGRWAVLEFDAGRLADSVPFYCSVGDHRDLGMSGLLELG